MHKKRCPISPNPYSATDEVTVIRQLIFIAFTTEGEITEVFTAAGLKMPAWCGIRIW